MDNGVVVDGDGTDGSVGDDSAVMSMVMVVVGV